MTSALELRRARVRQMIAEGRVMTDSKRAKIKAEAKRRQQLEDMGDRILAQSNRVSSVPMGTVVEMVDKEQPPEANVQLKKSTKVDALAMAADAILREIQSV
jgi:16S rRNA U516 pseudouridylate synthase RsuA-like enzyme